MANAELSTGTTKSDSEPTVEKLKFRIGGDDLPYLDVLLRPGDCFVAEPGALMDMDEGIEIGTVLGDGSTQRPFISRLWNALKRPFTGESLFSVLYTNPTEKPLRLSLAAPYPGTIFPVDLKKLGGSIICQRGAFLCGEQGTQVGIAMQKRLRVGFFGGEGFVMQKIEGDGIAFIHAGGSLVARKLAPGQNLRVDTGCLAALQSSVSYNIRYTGKLKTALFGGEGLFHAELSGPGIAWVQSMPLARLAQSIVNRAVIKQSGGGGTGRLYLWLIVIFVLFTLFGGMEIPEE